MVDNLFLMDVICIQAFCFFVLIGLICSVNFISFLCRRCGMDGFNIIIVKEF